jgi:hypothetical protein
MKKIFIVMFACSVTLASAQLKVGTDGKVGIGITGTPISRLSVGTTGDPYFYSMIEGDKITLRINGLAASPYDIGHWGTGILVSTLVNSTRGDKGVEVMVTKGSPSSSGRALGVIGVTGNATSGYNYGLIGALAGSNGGTGIFATALGNYQGIYINGTYAGYFQGDVLVTGTVNGVTLSSSDIRYKQNVEEIDQKSALNSILKLKPISYNYKQVYDEPESDTLQVKTGFFDENSLMFKKKHFGLIAQELEEIYPELVYKQSNGYLAVNYVEIVPLLVQSVKELKKELDDLKGIALRSTTLNGVIGGDATQAVLYQNAPNPFTDKTVISFSLPQTFENAYIYVFNLQGGLLKQIPVSKGQTSVTIYGSELSAGMYLYSLLINGIEIDTKRMILTK